MCPTHGHLNEGMPHGCAGPARSGQTAGLMWVEWVPGQLHQGNPGSGQVMATKGFGCAGRFEKTRDLRLIGCGAEEGVRAAYDEVRHLVPGIQIGQVRTSGKT